MKNTAESAAMPKLDPLRYLRLAKEGAWIVAGQIAAVLGALVLVRVLTEHLDPAQYGQLALGLTVAGFANQIVFGGISGGIGRFYSIAVEKQGLHGYLRDSRKLLGYATLAVVALGLLLMVGLFWLGYTQWIGLAAAALILAVLAGFNGALSSIQTAARQRAVVALHGGLDAWLKIILAVGVMLWLGSSSTAVVLGYAISSALVTLSQLFFIRRTLPQGQASKDSKFLQQMWTYSWPFSAWGIFTWIQLGSDRWALAAFASTEDVGRYAVLFQLGYSPIALVTGMAATFLAPILYQRSGDATNHSRNASVHRLAWRVTGLCLAVTGCAFVFALLLHNWLFQHLVAARFRTVSYFLPWLVLAGGVFAAGQMLAVKLTSEMNIKDLLRPKIGSAIVGVALNILGAWYFGLAGVVAALVGFSAVYFVWMAWVAQHLPAEY